LRVRDDAPAKALTVSSSMAPEPRRAAARRLKICYVAETVRTGVGRHLRDLIEAMTARGHEIHLLHSFRRTDPHLLREIQDLPRVRCEAFAMRREPHWSDISVIYALARYIRRKGPFDVVHGHSSKGGAYARLLGLQSRCKRVYTPHAFVTMSPHLSSFDRGTYACVERGLSYLSDRIICTSDLERTHAVELGIRLDKLTVVPNGLSPYDVRMGSRARERLGLAADVVVIGFVGRMDAQKAPERLVEAAARIIGRGRKLHIVMIGDGPLRESLMALTRRLHVADAFSWLGVAVAREWLTAFDVLAMPSRYEGFSYVLLEALHNGVPVVCTAVGGVAEAIEDGVDGFVVPHDDIDALAHRLTQLADDPDLRVRMGLCARRRSTQFSLQRMVDGTEEVYFS
jgi:glycosyltransferase involved in cell wall biosynthesis